MRLQAIIEKLISHRFFRRKQGLPRMAKHMEEQRHRILYAEDILRLNADSRATTSDDDADAGSGGKAGAAASPQMLAVALQNGPRGPEVSNLQTDSAELFYAARTCTCTCTCRAHAAHMPCMHRACTAPHVPCMRRALRHAPWIACVRHASCAQVRCGFARGFELLRPPDTPPRDAWDVACEAFPDSILEEASHMYSS